MDSFWRNHVINSPSKNKSIKTLMLLPFQDKDLHTIVEFQFVIFMIIVFSIGVFYVKKPVRRRSIARLNDFEEH
jgi:hypothetical protein